MKGNDRLNPTIFHSCYVHLSHLRDATIKKIDELTANQKDLLLVDFGCGDMPYRYVIEPLVGKYLGVDLEMNPRAEHHVNFDSKTTLPDNYADIVLSNQVLEHVDSRWGIFTGSNAHTKTRRLNYINYAWLLVLSPNT